MSHSHRRLQAPPKFAPARSRPAASGPPSLLELDRFTAADLERWNKLSKDLDQLNAVLHSGVEPQRQRYYGELLAALQLQPPESIDFDGWVRIVTLRFADQPLSAVGSLKSWGGRFNVGLDVDNATRSPWPALYIASNQETAYREKFGIAKSERVDGLTADELALQTDGSYSAIRLNGRLSAVFNVAAPGALEPLCDVLRKIHMPAEAVKLRARLKIPRQQLSMIRSAKQLLHHVLEANWRVGPAQYGIPAPSQILASLLLDAGYEAIRYPSTKGTGDCVAVFPHCLADDDSFVMLADQAPPSVNCTRLDTNTADALCGWEMLPRYMRRPQVG